jgi:hypothetical protein
VVGTCAFIFYFFAVLQYNIVKYCNWKGAGTGSLLKLSNPIYIFIPDFFRSILCMLV